MSLAADNGDGFFVVGAPVQPDRPSYVFRPADQELRARLRAGEYCHVLAPRQTGKTSLMVQTAHRLRGDGCDVAMLDLADIGGRKVADDMGRWYYSFAYRVLRELRIRTELSSWWQERSALTIRQRLRDFFLEVVLVHTQRPVVIFLDRIEAVAWQPEARDLFDAIRGCFDARTTEPECARLVFALLGGSGAERLAGRGEDSVFAVSVAVPLGDFTPGELGTLTRGLGLYGAAAEDLADRIWHWSSGHPYLSQRLCRALARQGVRDAAAVDAQVARLFFSRNAQREDPHLGWLARRLTQPPQRCVAKLTLYGRVRKGVRVPLDAASPVQRELCDLGLLVDADGVLAVRNRIYAGAFTALWVNRNLPFRWRSVAVAALVVLTIFAVPLWYRDYLPRPWVRVLQAERQEFVVARAAWQRLRMLPGFRAEADRLFVDYLVRQSRRARRLPEVQRIGETLATLPGGAARAEALLEEFWNRRAALMAQRGDRDGALLYTLQNRDRPDPERGARLAGLLGADLAALSATLRPGSPLTDVEFDADNGLLTTLDDDHEISVWRIGAAGPGREQRLRLAPESGAAGPAATTVVSLLGPAGRRALVWASLPAAGGAVQVWDVAKARVLARLEPPADLRAARFVLGHSAVLLLGAGEIILRDSASGRLIGRLALPGGERVGPVLSGNGRFLALDVEGAPGVAALGVWDLNGLRRIGRIVTGARASAVALDDGAAKLAVGDGERLVRIWAVRGGALLAQCEHAAAPVAAQFDPQGRYLATQDGHDRLYLWDLAAGCRPLLVREGNGPWRTGFAGDGERFIAGNYSRGFELFALPGGARLGPALQPGMSSAGSAPATRAARPQILPGRAGILTYDGRKAVKLWSLPAQDAGRLAAGGSQLAVSTDGGVIALGTVEGELRIGTPDAAGQWRVDTVGEPAYFGHRAAVTRVVFDVAGQVVASGSLDGSVRIWDVATGMPRQFFAVHGDGAIQDLAFLPEGSAVVSVTGRSVLVSDAQSGRPLARLGIEARQAAVAISPDGAFIFIAGDRDGLTRWAWRTGEVTVLGEGDYRVRRVAVAGDVLATVGADRVVRLWWPQSGVPQQRGFTAAAPVEDLWFAGGGKRLYVKAGAWLHALEVGTAGLDLQGSEFLGDADARVLPAAGGDVWRVIAASSIAPQRVRWPGGVPPTAPGPTEAPAAAWIQRRVALGVGEAGDLRSQGSSAP
jgi:WD40 repeat protein